MRNLIQQQKNVECLWMQAGVVKKKLCLLNFECAECRFNRAMNRVCMGNDHLREQGLSISTRRSGFEFWMDRLRKKPVSRRPCIHTMKGRIDFKNCPKSYHCNDCEFDLYFHDQFRIHTVMQPVGYDDIHGVSLPKGYYLHEGHAWIKLEDHGMVRIGIDDFASHLCGTFTDIQAPLMGKELVHGAPMLSLTRSENHLNFVAPVSGVVMEVNKAIKKDPGMIHSAPYTDGWIFLVYSSNLKLELRNLMFMSDSNKYMNAEVIKLYDFIKKKNQLKAADGGQLVDDIYGNLPDVKWTDLVNRFIRQ